MNKEKQNAGKVNKKENQNGIGGFESFTFEEPVCSAEFAEGCLLSSDEDPDSESV